jgi:16S rRNA (guanine1207-N2)-methyltransferase
LAHPHARILYALEHNQNNWGTRARIALIGIASDYPIAQVQDALGAQEVTLVQWRADDHQRLTRMGHEVLSDLEALTGHYDAVLIVLPRAKAFARDLIARATEMCPDGLILVDGAKEDGADAMLKDLRRMNADPASLSKAHGRVMWCAPFDASAWRVPSAITVDTFETTFGIFSAEAVDAGSALLCEHLPTNLKGRVADLGTGWGYLAHHVLVTSPEAQIDAVEIDARAVACAQRNLTSFEGRVTCHWADVTQEPQVLGKAQYDHIVMNPPFHQGRKAQFDLGRAFIGAAARLLRPKGTLWMVANRHLPYEDTLENLFKQVNKPHQTGAFKILQAQGVN